MYFCQANKNVHVVTTNDGDIVAGLWTAMLHMINNI